MPRAPSRTPSVSLAILFCTSLFGQSILTDGLPAAAQPGYSAISQDKLREHLNFLAGDAPQGRGNGQPGLKIAADYLADHYRQIGLATLDKDSSYFQLYELKEARVLHAGLAIETDLGQGASLIDAYHNNIDFALNARGLTTDRTLSAEVVFVGYGITAPEYGYDDYSGIKVTGKVVLALRGEPARDGDADFFNGPDRSTRHSFRRTKAAVASANGALALLLIPDPRDPDAFREGLRNISRFAGRKFMVLPGFSSAALPVYFIRPAIAERLMAGSRKSLEEAISRLEKQGRPHSFALRKARVRLAYELEVVSHGLQNVVALLPGSDPLLKDEYVVISAHYDHEGIKDDGVIYYGADDNGSGTSALLEIARAFTANSQRPRRSVLFLHISGEERGLLGSRYFAEYPLVPRSSIIADLNIDMVGRNDPDSIYVIGTNMLSWDLHWAGEAAAALVPDLHLSYKYNNRDDPNRFYYRSDHYNFARFNIPVTFYFAGVHEDYHRPTDTPDKINYAKLRKVARLVYLTAWDSANRDERYSLDGLLVE